MEPTLTPALKQALAQADLAGGVVMVGDRNGVTMCHAFGKRDLAAGDAMADDALFQIASMTKAIVTVGALQLVEQGRLSLDTDIGTVLPELANPQVIAGFGEDGTVQLRPAKGPVTLRHLLTHTSGLGYDFVSADQLRARGPGGPPPMGTKAALITPLLFDPGERWEYGVGIDWAGLAIEAVTGQRLDAYLNTHILDPLGMSDTCFVPTAEQRARVASLYTRTPDGLVPMPIEIGGGPDVEVLSGGGGLYSTAADYMRFCRMILGDGMLDGVRIISADTVAQLKANQIGDLRAGRMDSAMPMLAPPFDLFPDMHTRWSLAYLINPDTGPNGRSPGTLAWAGIANCYYWIDPAKDIVGIFLTQLLPFGDTNTLAALGAFERSVYGLE